MKKCPRCGRNFERLLAVSRYSKENICDQCGTEEALDMAGFTEGNPDREYILETAYGKDWKKS